MIKLDQINKIIEERELIGIPIATVPDGFTWGAKEYKAIMHILNDIKKFRLRGINIPIGIKIEILP